MSSIPNASELPPSQLGFRQLIGSLTSKIHTMKLDQELDDWLNLQYGVESDIFAEMQHFILEGVKEGWLCNREGAGIRYGRVFKPAEDLHGFSVDVVDMENISGPRHIHPLGEIDLIIPIQGDALFDGRPAGWMVTPPQSEHAPTVSNGRAYVLYLLPQGQIQFI